MKLVILDRDGVINQDSENYIKSEDEFMPIDGSLEAIKIIKNKGYKVVIATNQSGIAKNLFTIDTLNKIHNKLHSLLTEINISIDGIFYCPHNPEDNCSCRKPKPGLIHQIESYFNFKAADNEIYFIGDSERDLIAAKNGNCIPVLVRTGNGNKTTNPIIYNNLLEFAINLLS